MAKKLVAVVKLQCPAGAANPSPPVGPALGQHGVNIMEFCKAFNARTAEQQGLIIPAVISIFSDRTFTFVLKTPPVSFLICKAAGIPKGSSKPNTDKVAKLSPSQVTEIAKQKMADLNAHTVESAEQMVRGTARSMGVTVAD